MHVIHRTLKAFALYNNTMRQHERSARDPPQESRPLRPQVHASDTRVRTNRFSELNTASLAQSESHRLRGRGSPFLSIAGGKTLHWRRADGFFARLRLHLPPQSSLPRNIQNCSGDKMIWSERPKCSCELIQCRDAPLSAWMHCAAHAGDMAAAVVLDAETAFMWSTSACDDATYPPTDPNDLVKVPMSTSTSCGSQPQYSTTPRPCAPSAPIECASSTHR